MRKPISARGSVRIVIKHKGKQLLVILTCDCQCQLNERLMVFYILTFSFRKSRLVNSFYFVHRLRSYDLIVKFRAVAFEPSYINIVKWVPHFIYIVTKANRPLVVIKRNLLNCPPYKAFIRPVGIYSTAWDPPFKFLLPFKKMYSEGQ